MRGEGTSDLAKVLGRKLAILRESCDLTQAELARKAGITASSLSQYEAGKRMPEIPTLFRILKALGYGLAALDWTEEFCLGLRLTQRCRSSKEIPDPLRAQIASMAAEAGNAVSRLTDAVALLAGAEPISEQIRAAATAEGYPLPEDRVIAVELWEKLSKYPHEVRLAFVAELAEFQVWSLSELLSHKSVAAASESASTALELASLALEVAQRVRGGERRQSRSKGYARGHLGNAQRVQGDLRTAEESFALSDEEWKAGEGSPGDLLNEVRLLDLKASLRRGQRRLPEALELLDEALAASGPELKGHLLINKAKVLEEQDDLDRAISTLEEAEPQIDREREPRLWLCARHNRMWCLTTAGRHQEAEELLPEVRSLSLKLGKELDRIRLRWAEGRIAAGLGRTQQGIDLLTQVRAEFVSRTMWFDAALVTLELAVVFLQQGRTDMVKTLAAHLGPIFKSNGVHREALAALSLFRKAADQEKVTLEMARKLVVFLRKAQHDPELKF
ncbi:MAG TPA: helix-turn-helix transcriptional regulator [Thermoanaerobaculia bacterium]|nr:helix-turn-helix transcriptional regulator [Thermoanaerobaculia bacterium]